MIFHSDVKFTRGKLPFIRAFMADLIESMEDDLEQLDVAAYNTHRIIGLPPTDITILKDKAYDKIFDEYRHRAARKGMKWELSKSTCIILFSSLCYYCGSKPNNSRFIDSDLARFRYNGIDRVISHIGYTIDNVVSCCSRCNRAKLKTDGRRFIRWLRAVSAHYRPTDFGIDFINDNACGIVPYRFNIPSGDLVEIRSHLIVSRSELTINASGLLRIKSGISLNIPDGMMVTICSPYTFTDPLFMTHHTPQIIDKNYNLELEPILVNHNEKPIKIPAGDPIARIVLSEIPSNGQIKIKYPKNPIILINRLRAATERFSTWIPELSGPPHIDDEHNSD